jgi:hypothetical protein
MNASKEKAQNLSQVVQELKGEKFVPNHIVMDLFQGSCKQ